MRRRTAVSNEQQLDEVVKACARGRHPRGRWAVRRALAVRTDGAAHRFQACDPFRSELIGLTQSVVAHPVQPRCRREAVYKTPVRF